jgi:hypothetical protein
VSYDLAVWEGLQPDTDDAAAAAFEDLCDRYLQAEARHEPTQKINQYVESLLIRWPDISDDAGACSPWASAPLIDEAIGPIVHFPMVFSQAAEAAGFAATLAWAQGLVCFDTQHGQLRLPPFDYEEVDRLILDGKTIPAIAEMRRQGDLDLPTATSFYEQRALVLSETSRPAAPGRPALVLTTPRGRRINNPPTDVLQKVLPELGTERWFAILERQTGWFIQAGYGARAGTRPGWYALERQDGASHRHSRTITSDLQDVIAAFIGFAGEDAYWMRRFAWEPYQIQPQQDPR